MPEAVAGKAVGDPLPGSTVQTYHGQLRIFRLAQGC
jgi:hypothetical protein